LAFPVFAKRGHEKRAAELCSSGPSLGRKRAEWRG
jgi:hypothetical protein